MIARSVRELATPFVLRYHRRRNRGVLSSLIKDKRILIVGTGPSAANLGAIPDDVRVFTCKLGVKLFAERRCPARIDLYSCFRSGLENETRIAEFLTATKPRVFMSNDLRYVRSRRDLDGAYSTLLHDSGDDNYVLDELIRPLTVKDIQGRARRTKTSSGVRLLQYALYYGASEVYLSGIDLGRRGYVWPTGNEGKPWNHVDIDENFLKLVSKTYRNVFSLCKDSPASEHLEHHEFAQRPPTLAIRGRRT